MLYKDQHKGMTEEHKAKICLEMICEFIQQIPAEAFEGSNRSNFSTDDYSLKQFQQRIGKKIPYNYRYIRRKELKRFKR